MTPMFFLAALWGCMNSDGAVDDTAGTWIEVEMTVHAAIDGETIDPVDVDIYEADCEPTFDNNCADDLALATDKLTGETIVMTIPKTVKAARAWIGSAATSSDGHSILEHNGRQWVHPIADLPIEDGLEKTISLNGYFPPTRFSCTRTKWAYDDSDPEYKGEEDSTKNSGEHVLEVTSGKDILQPEEGLDDLLAPGCNLESSGSGFAVVCEDDYMQTVSSSWNGDGFTVLATITDRMTLEYTCVVM